MKAIFFALFSNILLFSFVQGQSSRGFIFERHEYVYKIVLAHEDPRTWLEAERICQNQENGQLVSISSRAELEWLNSKVVMVGQNNRRQKLWLGATDKDHYGKYKWVDGEPFNNGIAPWAAGHPRKGDMEYEMCVSIDTSPDGAQWKDVDCYNAMGYICKSVVMPSRIVGRTRYGVEYDYGYYAYKFIAVQQEWLSWPEAEIYCDHVEGGHLLSVTGPRESKRVKRNLKALRQLYGPKSWWIGASDFETQGFFRWVDGSPFNYTLWARGQPKQDRMEADCVSILQYSHGGRWYTDHCLHKKSFICKMKMCNKRIDLGIILDSSGSMLASGFRQAKKFIKKVILKFKVSKRGTHVGLIRFANTADLIFDFSRYTAPNALYKAIDKMKWTEGGTRTEKALELARTRLFTKAGHVRPMVSKVLLLLTDGESEWLSKVREEAQLVKNSGVFVVAVGVGEQVNRDELNAIASSDKHVIGVNSFPELMKRVQEIWDKLCEGTDPHSGIKVI